MARRDYFGAMFFVYMLNFVGASALLGGIIIAFRGVLQESIAGISIGSAAAMIGILVAGSGELVKLGINAAKDLEKMANRP